MSLSQRIKNIRTTLNLNQAQLADKIKIKQPSISALESGGNISFDTVEKFRKYLNINPEYLSGRSDSMFLSSDVLQKAHGFNDNTGQGNSTSSRPANQHESEKKNLTIVPLKAFGGFTMGYADRIFIDSLEKIYFPWIQGECFAFQVEGSSMYKTYNIEGEILSKGYAPGSYVITTKLNLPDLPTKGKDYVFQTIDGILLKKFVAIKGEKMYLESINKDYDPITVPVKSVKGIYYVEDTSNNKPQQL